MGRGKLRVFENRDMRRIFGPRKELHNFYSSPNVMRMI
jgi:hypothetical protein